MSCQVMYHSHHHHHHHHHQDQHLYQQHQQQQDQPQSANPHLAASGYPASPKAAPGFGVGFAEATSYQGSPTTNDNRDTPTPFSQLNPYHSNNNIVKTSTDNHSPVSAASSPSAAMDPATGSAVYCPNPASNPNGVMAEPTGGSPGGYGAPALTPGQPQPPPSSLQRLGANMSSGTSGELAHNERHSPQSDHRTKVRPCLKGGEDAPGLGGPQCGTSEEAGDPAAEATSAQYLTANCVVVTYFTGDSAQVVDEHFSRALNGEKSPTENLPLSQRNLPPSFWNSDYQYHPPHSASSTASSLSSLAAGHAALAAGHELYPHAAAAAADPYANSALFSGATNDPWQNYMAAAASGSYSAHRAGAAAMHDMYSARLNQQYSSLFLPSSAAVRQRGKGAADGWGGSSGHGTGLDGYGSSHSHYSAAAMTGLEGSMQGSSKDLYWF